MQSTTIPSHRVNTASSPDHDLPASTRKFKIALVGASGKIGGEVLKNIWMNSEKFSNVECLVALNTVPRVTQGLFYDVREAEFMSIRRLEKSAAIKTIATDNFAELKNVEVIFITAGQWPDDAIRKKWKDDSTGRLAQSEANKPLISKICKAIAQYAPRAIVCMVTNQVDMMTELARKLLPNEQVIGLGGYLDTNRYKVILADLLYDAGYININDPSYIEAHIVGFHNVNMFVLQDSVKINGKTPDWNDMTLSNIILDKAVKEMRERGKMVSDLKKHPKYPEINSGASIAPAQAITNVIHAICSSVPLSASFNLLLDEQSAHLYGVQPKTALSIPVVIQGKEIKPVLSFQFKIFEQEKRELRRAQEELAQDMQKLHQAMDNPLVSSDSSPDPVSIKLGFNRSRL